MNWLVIFSKSLEIHNTVDSSSTLAKYIALAQAICEAKWLRNLQSEIGIECVESTIIQVDSQACITVIEEPQDHKRMKHIDIKYNFIR